MVKAPHQVTFELWDVDNPDQRSILGPFEHAPLSRINEAWELFIAEHIAAPHGGESLNVGSLRVSMSRNNGRGVLVNDVEAGDKLYKVKTTVTRPLQQIVPTDEMWRAGVEALQNAVDQDQSDLEFVVQDIFNAMMDAR